MTSLIRFRTVGLALCVATAHAAAQDAPCQRTGACVRVPAFDAAVTDFRISPAEYGGRLITATVRFTNRTDRPLILGYVSGSGVSLDDQGNRHVVYGNGAVRGMGEITSNNFDPKFALRPGEASDARFELVFRPQTRGQIIGTRYDLALAVRQIDPLPGNQLRLGREHSLHFQGFGSGQTMASGATTAAPLTAPAPVTSGGDAAITPETDLCAGRARCYSAGTFVAEVTQFTAGVEGRHHVLRSVIRFRNTSAQPLILAYKPSTNGATDNLGNRYLFGRPSTHDMSMQGMGMVSGGGADPQFALSPGQSREARFSVIRFEVGNKQLGTSFTQDLSVLQLEPLPSGQIRVGREYAVSLRDLAAGGAITPAGGATSNAAGNAAVGEAAKKLFDAIRNRKKKP